MVPPSATSVISGTLITKFCRGRRPDGLPARVLFQFESGLAQLRGGPSLFARRQGESGHELWRFELRQNHVRFVRRSPVRLPHNAWLDLKFAVPWPWSDRQAGGPNRSAHPQRNYSEKVQLHPPPSNIVLFRKP